MSRKLTLSAMISVAAMAMVAILQPMAGAPVRDSGTALAAPLPAFSALIR